MGGVRDIEHDLLRAIAGPANGWRRYEAARILVGGGEGPALIALHNGDDSVIHLHPDIAVSVPHQTFDRALQFGSTVDRRPPGWRRRPKVIGRDHRGSR